MLGQEQDALGKNFSANEAFIGDMSQMNVWSYELPAKDIASMSRHSSNIIGNVVSWGDFFLKADNGVHKVQPSVARKGLWSSFEYPRIKRRMRITLN